LAARGINMMAVPVRLVIALAPAGIMMAADGRTQGSDALDARSRRVLAPANRGGVP
jgi:hypothetical protein